MEYSLSLDRRGRNVEETKQIEVKIDRTSPIARVGFDPELQKIVVSGSDELSEVTIDSCMYSHLPLQFIGFRRNRSEYSLKGVDIWTVVGLPLIPTITEKMLHPRTRVNRCALTTITEFQLYTAVLSSIR